jgi:hypothetical protein
MDAFIRDATPQNDTLRNGKVNSSTWTEKAVLGS